MTDPAALHLAFLAAKNLATTLADMLGHCVSCTRQGFSDPHRPLAIGTWLSLDDSCHRCDYHRLPGDIEEPWAPKARDLDWLRMLTIVPQHATFVRQDDAVQGGQPCILGTKVLVSNVIELLEAGFGYNAIAREYALTPMAIDAARLFALAYPSRIQRPETP